MARKGTSKSLKRFDVAPEYLYPVSHTAMTSAATHLLHVKEYEQDIKDSQNIEDEDASYWSRNHYANPNPGEPWDMTPHYYEGTSLHDNMRHIPSLKKEANELMSGLKLPTDDAITEAATDNLYNHYHYAKTGGYPSGKYYYPKRSENGFFLDDVARWGYNEQDFMTKDQLPKKSDKRKVKSIDDADHNPMDTLSWDDNAHHVITGKWLTKGYGALPSTVDSERTPLTRLVSGAEYTPEYRGFIQHQYDRVRAGQPKTTIEEYVTNHVPNHEAIRRKEEEWWEEHNASKSKKKPKPSPTKVEKPKAEKPKAPSKPLSKNQFGGDWGAEQLELF